MAGWLPFTLWGCCLVWLISLVCSCGVSCPLQSVTGRRRLHPLLGQPAGAPAGTSPDHRGDQAGDPAVALRSSSCWRWRWREWVLTAEWFTFLSFSWHLYPNKVVCCCKGLHCEFNHVASQFQGTFKHTLKQGVYRCSEGTGFFTVVSSNVIVSLFLVIH